jgi:thiol-disulfide isomerase/thioredoxin
MVSNELKSVSTLDWVLVVGLLFITAVVIYRLYDDRNDMLQEEEGDGFLGCAENFANPKTRPDRKRKKRRRNDDGNGNGGGGGGDDDDDDDDDEGDKAEAASTGKPEPLRSIDEATSPKENELILLFIYHSGCGHCVAFKPTWQKLCAKYHNTRINSKKVRLLMAGDDVDEALWNTTSTHYSVTGFPTVMVIKKGSEATEYTGPRNDMDVWRSNLNKMTAS